MADGKSQTDASGFLKDPVPVVAKQSRSTIQYPFSSEPLLREEYRNPSGRVRVSPKVGGTLVPVVLNYVSRRWTATGGDASVQGSLYE